MMKNEPTPDNSGKRIVAYLRVSSIQQDLDSQRHGILEFAKNEGLQPIEFVEEKVSGKTPINERAIQEVLDSLQKGDVLIISELSRLGRKMVEVMQILDCLVQKEVLVFAVKGGYRLDGSLPSKILSMVLLMAAEIESELISLRTREAIAKRKASGLPIGRPKGSTSVSKLDKHEDVIRDLVEKGVTLSNIAKIVGASWPTVNDWVLKKGLKQPRVEINPVIAKEIDKEIAKGKRQRQIKS